MLSVENVATPATAAAVVAPDSVAPPVPVPAVIVSVTLPVKVVAVRPEASRAVTCTAGLMAAPAVVLIGCAVKISWGPRVAVPSNGALLAPPGPPAVGAGGWRLPARSR